MYDPRNEMTLTEFAAVQGIPSGDEIRVVRPLCNDDGETIKAEPVYTGKAGAVTEEIGALMVDAVNSSYWRNQSGYWHIELVSVYASEQAAA